MFIIVVKFSYDMYIFQWFFRIRGTYYFKFFGIVIGNKYTEFIINVESFSRSNHVPVSLEEQEHL